MTRKRPPTDFEEAMGTRLQQLRQAAGLTQQQLAEKADVPIRSLQNWEYGRRTPMLDAAAKLAEALGVTVGVLAGTEPMPRPKKRRKP